MPGTPETLVARWFGLPLARFRSDFFRKRPTAHPATGLPFCRLLDFPTVGRILRSPDLDGMVVRNGRLLDRTVPASLADLRSLLGRGCSLVLRGVEAYDPLLQRLADRLAGEIPGRVRIQVYVTPAGFHSFGWHYDAEDVFVLQTRGCKDYYFRENTVNPRPRLEAMPRDMQFERETTPLQMATLLAGDCLYLPSGWWHVARCREESLSLSIGLLPAEPAPRRGTGATR